jgi:hypothetical protein
VVRAATNAGERGSGTVLAVALAGMLVSVTVASLWLVSATVCVHRARAAADLAALAAVTAARHGLAGSAGPDGSAGSAGPAGPASTAEGGPCSAARQTAVSNGAELTGCVAAADETVLVTVRVALMVPIPGVSDHALASSRAGPGHGPPG